jgi:hypothetical protein
MQAMYSWSNFATHHIFFPPRLQVVAFQQHPNGLSAHARNQFAFDDLFGQQPHRPTRSPFRRRRADHGDNLLALALVQDRSFARTRGVEQRSLQPFLLIPLADLPHRFGRKTKIPAHNRRGLSLIHLTQGQGTQYRAHRLQTAAQHLVQLPARSSVWTEAFLPALAELGRGTQFSVDAKPPQTAPARELALSGRWLVTTLRTFP